MKSGARMVCSGVSLGFGAIFLAFAAFAQSAATPEISPQAAPRPLLSPGDLDTLVAPIALYPDPLLSQVLAASTYPLELVEAEQWMEQHPGLRSQELIEAAKQMNWDASVQAMVAFPDVLRTLTQNVSWTTDLGNAFLAQQADVMDAIQRMRAQARQNGRLGNTPQQVVTTESGPEPNQSVVAIQPANPQVMYVPTYNPYYVWGPPAVGAYPALGYPEASSGIGFGAAIGIANLFAGLLSWSGWGWGLSWLTHGLFLNGLFFNHYGYPSYGGGYSGSGGYRGFGGSDAVYAWAHNPAHRMGIPYPTRTLAGRFGAAYRGDGMAGHSGNRGSASPYRGGWQGAAGRSSAFSSSGYSAQQHYAPQQHYYSPERPYHNTQPYSNPQQHYYSPERPYNNRQPYYNPQQHYYNPQQHYSNPQQHYYTPQQHSSKMSYKAPGWSGAGGHYSAPKASGHFKPPKMPKISSHSSGHSSGGGHSKGHHH